MAVTLSQNEQDIFNKAKEFSLDYFQSRAAEWEENRVLPADVLTELRKNGCFGIGCSAEFGGQGLSWFECALVYEGMAHGDSGITFFIQLHNTLTKGLETGYDKLSENVKALMPDFVKGNKLLAFGLTDDDGGSDPGQTKAYAVKENDGYHLFGSKSWVSNNLNADYFMVFVHDKTDDRAKGMIMFLVPKDAPGFKVKEDIRRVGGNVMSCGRIEMDDALIGEEFVVDRDGLRRAFDIINIARVYVSAISVGVSQRAIDITAKYLSGRETFGVPVLDNQAVLFELADLSARTEAARWLARRAATVMDTGEPLTVITAKAKYFAPETAMYITTQCAQLFGAVGLETASEITRCLNAARAFRIVDGSSQVQQIIIGRDIQKGLKTK